MPLMNGSRVLITMPEDSRRGRIHVAMTAHALKKDEKCLYAGMDSYISKPINLRERCR